MAADINAIANRVGAAAASSKTQEQANQASIELSSTLPKILSGDKLQVQGMREFGDKMAQDLIKDAQSGKLVEGLGKAEKAQENYFTGALDDMSTGVQTAFKGLSESSNPLIQITSNLAGKMGDLIIKNENLDSSFFKLTTSANNAATGLSKTNNETSKTNVNVIPPPPTTTKEEMKSPPKVSEAATTEMKFTNPIEIKVTLLGFPSGMKEEDIKKMIEEGKFSQEIIKAISEADKQKTKQ
jgi:hypothetical protein